MENVKLNQNQINMFENHKGSSIKTLIEKYINKNIRTYIDDLTLEELVQCILGNYELEKTPEEKLLDVFNSCDSSEHDMGFKSGLRRTLHELGIKIKGINS